jgi:hypothetical protein
VRRADGGVWMVELKPSEEEEGGNKLSLKNRGLGGEK